MSRTSINFERKTIGYIIIAMFIVMIPTLMVTYFISINVFITFLILSLIFIIIIPIIFTRFFLRPQKRCPRCNAEVSEYDEYCKNCGLQLLSKCPKCGKLMKFEDISCRYCGYERKKVIIPEDVEIELVSKENDQKLEKSQIKGQLNFCPSCGTKLKPSQQNLRFCEFCGSKLN